MTEARIAFTNLQASGEEEAGGASPIAMNVLVEPSGTVRRRPGMVASQYATNGIIAGALSLLHVTLDGRIYVADENPLGRHLYRVTSGGYRDLSTLGGNSILLGSGRPQSVETEMLLVVAAGRDMQKVILSSDVSDRLAGSPPLASHVIGNASRLLANDVSVDRTKVRYSDLAQGTVTYAGHETWTPGPSNTSGFFTAEARPDPVVALGDSANEVLVFGSRTIQVYGSDETFVFSPVATLEIGCGAAYSVVRVDDAFFCLDDKRRFVKVTGRDYEVISAPIRRTLEGIVNVDDCFGYRILSGPFDILVWTFPSDGRTFSYQVGVGWSQWASFGNGNWMNCDITAAAQHPSGKHLVGTNTGVVRELSLGSPLDASGRNIRAYVETGYENRKTDARKHCQSVRLTIRRQSADGVTQAFFGWRDEPGDWAARIPIATSANDRELVVQFYSLGVYRRRQWFFEWTGSDEMALVSAVEDFEVL